MPKLVFQPNLNVNNEKTETNYENSLYFYPYRLPHTFAKPLCRHLVYPILLFLMSQELAIGCPNRYVIQLRYFDGKIYIPYQGILNEGNHHYTFPCLIVSYNQM